jgi:hypothetical protein
LLKELVLQVQRAYLVVSARFGIALEEQPVLAGIEIAFENDGLVTGAYKDHSVGYRLELGYHGTVLLRRI